MSALEDLPVGSVWVSGEMSVLEDLPAGGVRWNREVPALEHLLEVYRGVDKCLHLKTYLLEVLVS